MISPVLYDSYTARYWLCSATGPTIKVWDQESKTLVEKLRLCA